MTKEKKNKTRAFYLFIVGIPALAIVATVVSLLLMNRPDLSNPVVFILENWEASLSHFEQADLQAGINTKLTRDRIEIENNKHISYIFSDNHCQILFEKTDEDRNEAIDFTITYWYRNNDQVQVRISAPTYSGYNDYPINDFSEPIYEPVTDDGQEAKWDMYIKTYVSEDELTQMIQDMYTYEQILYDIMEDVS